MSEVCVMVQAITFASSVTGLWVGSPSNLPAWSRHVWILCENKICSVSERDLWSPSRSQLGWFYESCLDELWSMCELQTSGKKNQDSIFTYMLVPPELQHVLKCSTCLRSCLVLRLRAGLCMVWWEETQAVASSIFVQIRIVLCRYSLHLWSNLRFLCSLSCCEAVLAYANWITFRWN